MPRIDETGLVWSEPGDVWQWVHRIRPHDYGPILTERPLGCVWHLTGNRIAETCEASSCDGTEGMSGRAADGTARYYPNGYVGRDGHAIQVVPFTRCAIHVAGKFMGHETNRVTNGLEITNVAYARLDGHAPGFEIDPERHDFRQHGRMLWQMLTAQQLSGMLEFAPVWQEWSGARPEDCVLGHHDVDTDSSHVDPGPEEGDFLRGPVLAKIYATVAARFGAMGGG